MAELRYLLTEALCNFQNGEMSENKLNALGKMGAVIVNTVKGEVAMAMVEGVKKTIDFLPKKRLGDPVNENDLTAEFFEHDKHLATV